MDSKKKDLYLKILYLVFIFFVGALLGGVIEIYYQIITRGSFKIGGFMYGPFRPIYGWGCLLLHFIGMKFNKNIFVTFFASFIICSLFEYVSSFVLEILFNNIWWNYSDFLFNINGRICLSMSICWGLLGVVFINIIDPMLKRVYLVTNKNLLTIVLIFIFLIYKIDSLISIVNNFNKWN